MLDVIFAMRRNVGRSEWDDMRWEERGRRAATTCLDFVEERLVQFNVIS